MTLTEFNQNPSRASRLAEQGEVRVTRRGRPYLRLVRDDEPAPVLTPIERIDQRIAEGKMIPPAQTYGSAVFTDYEVDPTLAAQAMADFEEERRFEFYGY